MTNVSKAVLGVVLACAVAACGDDSDGDEHNEEVDVEGLQKCCLLGQVCHEGDTGGNSPTGDCHDIGHAMDAADCRAEYDACIALCTPEGEPELPEMCKDPTDGDAPHEEG